MQYRYLIIFLFVFILTNCTKKEALLQNPQHQFVNNFNAAIVDASTKTHVENLKQLWDPGDKISIFTTTSNVQYQYKGTTSTAKANFYAVDESIINGSNLSTTYAIYPYSESNKINTDGQMTITLPSIQKYSAGSFGLDANIMIAVAKNLEDKILNFKNLNGYLRLRMHGDATIKKIELQGLNNEKIAGDATVIANYSGVPSAEMSDNATSRITLDCGGTGVKLGSNASDATEFWFVVPTITFTKGVKITITKSDNSTITKLTHNEIKIERNTVKTMAPLDLALEEYIQFADINAKIKCIDLWDKNGDFELSYSEAAKVTSIKNAFSNSEIQMFNELKYFTGLTEISDSAFTNCKSLKFIKFPENITKIGKNAFEKCIALTQINLSEYITELGAYAFSKSGINSISIPAGVEILPIGVFKGCSNLCSISFEENSKLQIIGGEALFKYGYVSGYRCVGSNGAFSECINLQEIKLPSSVTIIEEGAFWGCKSLKSINTGELKKLIKIDGGLYEWSASNTYGYSFCGAFNGCSLETVFLPASLTELGHGIFAGNPSLKVYMLGTTPCKIPKYSSISAFIMKQDYQPAWTDAGIYDVYVPENALQTYKTADVWKYMNLKTYVQEDYK